MLLGWGQEFLEIHALGTGLLGATCFLGRFNLIFGRVNSITFHFRLSSSDSVTTNQENRE